MNPIADALRDLVSQDEAAFRRAPRSPQMRRDALRGRRRRIAAQATVVGFSLAALAGVGVAAADALGGGEGTSDPLAPPIPAGYERVVIPLSNFPDFPVPMASFATDFEPVLAELGLPWEEDTCGTAADVPAPTDSPFSLSISGVDFDEQGAPTEVGVPTLPVVTGVLPSTTLRFEGGAAGSVVIGWSLSFILTDGVLVSDPAHSMTGSGETQSASLEEPFEVVVPAYAGTPRCNPRAPGADPDWSQLVTADGYLSPGEYEIVVALQVAWSAQATVLAHASELGLDASWFGSDWRTEAPCAADLMQAYRAQDASSIECLPNLYYKVIRGDVSYAFVDVPTSVLDGPRQTWVVVSEPFPFEIPAREGAES